MNRYVELVLAGTLTMGMLTAALGSEYERATFYTSVAVLHVVIKIWNKIK